MLISRTSQYAIQALIYITTQPKGELILNRNISEHLGVPTAYLAKIMQGLCKGSLLHSYRGRQGGFCLREGAEKTTLMEVLLLTEGKGFTEDCVLGLKVCSDETACPLHTKWKPIKDKIVDLLRTLTLEKLAKAVKGGKYRICDLPAAVIPSLPKK
jgi:Rrf2 family protein